MSNNLAFKFIYDESRFDPMQVRNMLGVGGSRSRVNLPQVEQLRLANLLLRTGNISGDELAALKMRVIETCPKE